jgi:hypothetical protein
MSDRQYYKKLCPICFQEHKNRGVTCSRECATQKRRLYAASRPLTCVLCGNTFHTKDGKGKYCPDTHFKKCLICEKAFPIAKGKENKLNPTCGPSCGATYSHLSVGNVEKRKQNSLKKWGVEHPFQAPEVKAKIESSLVGTAGRFGTEASKAAIEAIYGVDNVSKLPEVKERKAVTYKRNYVDKGKYLTRGPVSKTNLRWKKMLEEATGLTWELERHFANVGNIDLTAEHNGKIVAVEINPTVTHNSYKNLISCRPSECETPCSVHALSKDYHFKKSKALKELHNVSLTSVFDWMDEGKVVAFLKARLQLDSNRVFARKTEVVPITQREANRFLNEFHMLGASRRQEYCYALMYEGQVVQVQTFARWGREEGAFEARRLATRSDFYVVGGVSRVTKRFIRDVNPVSIVAFSDLNLSWPDYDLMFNGFQRVSVNRPQKCWSKRKELVLDKSAARQSADRLLKIANNSSVSKYPESWSNEEVFLAEGWLPVWDCGMIKDEWRRSIP